LKKPSAYLRRKYNEYNDRYFKGRLPLGREVRLLVCSEDKMVNTGVFGEYEDFEIRIEKKAYGRPREKSQAQSTLLHEMVHMDLDFLGVDEKDQHGPRFQKGMLRLAKLGAFRDLW